MSTTPTAAATDPKQPAYDALNQLLATARAAANNPANTQAAQNTAYALEEAISAQLDALDQAAFTGNTVTLQAAATAMAPGIAQLKQLQTKIEALGNDLQEAASIISGIGKAAGELSVLG
jgi:hypothetical protein